MHSYVVSKHRQQYKTVRNSALHTKYMHNLTMISSRFMYCTLSVSINTNSSSFPPTLYANVKYEHENMMKREIEKKMWKKYEIKILCTPSARWSNVLLFFFLLWHRHFVACFKKFHRMKYIARVKESSGIRVPMHTNMHVCDGYKE